MITEPPGIRPSIAYGPHTRSFAANIAPYARALASAGDLERSPLFGAVESENMAAQPATKASCNTAAEAAVAAIARNAWARRTVSISFDMCILQRLSRSIKDQVAPPDHAQQTQYMIER
jgi:hypothetical protein